MFNIYYYYYYLILMHFSLIHFLMYIYVILGDCIFT